MPVPLTPEKTESCGRDRATGDTQVDTTTRTQGTQAGHTQGTQTGHSERTQPEQSERTQSGQSERTQPGQTQRTLPTHTEGDHPRLTERLSVENGAREPDTIPAGEADDADPDVVAGYQDCLKETIRFLIEEESLPDDHPVVLGLAAHLTRDHAHIELSKLSHHLSAPPTTTTTTTTQPPLTPNTPIASIPTATPLAASFNAGFEVTLVEDDSDDYDDDDEELMMIEEEMEAVECAFEAMSECESDEGEVEEVVMDLELQRQLLRLVYQGCDLFAAPRLAPPPSSAHCPPGPPPPTHAGLVLRH